MTAADKLLQNVTATIGNGSSSCNANTTTSANITSANQTSSENKTGNPPSNVPIIGDFLNDTSITLEFMAIVNIR